MHRSIWDASATPNIWSTEKRKNTGAFGSNQVRRIAFFACECGNELEIQDAGFALCRCREEQCPTLALPKESKNAPAGDIQQSPHIGRIKYAARSYATDSHRPP